MKKLLLTGFDPFAHYNINPSWEAVKALPEVIGSFSVHKMLLPNIYGTAGFTARPDGCCLKKRSALSRTLF